MKKLSERLHRLTGLTLRSETGLLMHSRGKLLELNLWVRWDVFIGQMPQQMLSRQAILLTVCLTSECLEPKHSMVHRMLGQA